MKSSISQNPISLLPTSQETSIPNLRHHHKIYEIYGISYERQKIPKIITI
jgi:hypothetical protein